MKTVAVVDYGMGNVDSVIRAIELCGARGVLTDLAEDFDNADSIILPGVGAFTDGMNNLRRRGLDEILSRQILQNGKPILRICLGMQLLADRGDEGVPVDGLGWIRGNVVKFETNDSSVRIPHIGWNEIHFKRQPPIFEGIPSGKDFYFVHSYHMVCDEADDVACTTPYCGEFVSAVCKKNIYGVQFHPEKSQKFGIRLISNFISLDSECYDKNENYTNAAL